MGGCEGIFFNVTASAEPIMITGFEHNVVGNTTVQVYYKPGSYQGSELNSGAWSSLGAQAVTGGTGPNQMLTPIAIGGLVIPAGQTYGVLLYTGYDDAGAGATIATRYANGNGNFSDANVSVSTGTASCSIDFGGGFPRVDNNPFNGTNANRIWHGSLSYTTDLTTAGRQAILDGRINRYDYAAPMGVYPHSVNGNIGLSVYDAYTTRNEPNELLVVSAAQIAAVPEFPEVNTLIAASADGRVSVYRLTDGLFQVQCPTYNGKEYVLQFDVIQSGIPYTSYEVD